MKRNRIFAMMTALCCIAGHFSCLTGTAAVPETIDLNQPGEGGYGLVKSVGMTTATNLPFIKVMLLGEDNFGEIYWFTSDVQETDAYQSEAKPKIGDLVYFEFSGTYRETSDDSYMLFAADDLLVTLGPVEDYAERQSFVLGKYNSATHQYPALREDGSVAFYTNEVHVDGEYAAYKDTVVFAMVGDNPLVPVDIIINEGRIAAGDVSVWSGTSTYLVLDTNTDPDTGLLRSARIHRVVGPDNTEQYAAYWELDEKTMKARISECFDIGCSVKLSDFLEGQKTLEAGDLIELDFTGDIAEVVPGCMHLYSESRVTNLGSAAEIGEQKLVTITEYISNMCMYVFEDADGKTYYYRDDPGRLYQPQTILDDTRVGDQLTCVFYADEPVQPLFLHPMGDVNSDNAVTIADVIFLNRQILGDVTAKSTFNQTLADYDANGTIDAADSLMILKRIVELI